MSQSFSTFVELRIRFLVEKKFKYFPCFSDRSFTIYFSNSFRYKNIAYFIQFVTELFNITRTKLQNRQIINILMANFQKIAKRRIIYALEFVIVYIFNVTKMYFWNVFL